MNLFKTHKNNLILTIVLSSLFFGLSFLFLKFENTNKSFSHLSEILNYKIQLEEKRAEAFSDRIIQNFRLNKQIDYFKDETFLKLSRQDGITILIYKNDSLEFWNDNSVELNRSLLKKENQNKLFHLGNGWYDCVRTISGNHDILSLILIKNTYAYQNEYIENKFNPVLSGSQVPCDIEISLTRGLFNVYSDKGDFLLSLNHVAKSIITNNLSEIIINVCNLFGIVFLIFSIFLCCRILFKSKIIESLTFTLLLIILRVIGMRFQIPQSFYRLDLFSPLYYAGSLLLPSLGDLLFDSLIVLIITLILFKSLQRSIIINNKNRLFIIAFLSVSFLFILMQGFIYLFKNLILNSTIIFNFTNIFNLSTFSYIGLIIISIWVFTYFLLSLLIIKNILPGLSKIEFFIILLIVSFITFLISFSFIKTIIPLITLLILWYQFKNQKENELTFKDSMLYILIFSCIITILLNKYNDIKEKDNRKVLVNKLAEQRDITAEFLFRNIENKINSDETFIDYLNKISDEKYEDEAKNYIQKKYFSGYWLKYNVQITFCESTDSLLIKPENINTNCSDFFFNMIDQTCKPSLTENLFYRNSESVTNSYIAHLEFNNNWKSANSNQKPVNIFIELDSKFIPKDLGYPKLLIDKNLDIENDYSNFSYAKYKDGELIYQFGKYFYRSKLENTYKQNKEFYFINRLKYNHLVYNAGNSTIYIISKENDSLVTIISPFSYLLIFISISFIILLLFIKNYNLKYKILNIKSFINRLSLQNRIEYSIISIVIFSFICIGTLSVMYINKTNDEKNIDNLSEKTHSILVELENKLSEHDTIPPSMDDYVSGLLMNLANEFFTDINLFNKNGKLIGTSRPKIYEEGLLSENMNPVACGRMISDNKTLFIQKENIGKLTFSSSYMPLRNINNKTIAYLNLPYFARQSENKNEISTFLTTFINIYILLVALSVFVVILISKYITKPLKLIQEKISNIKLGKTNEKLEWFRNDELGKLIKEYNIMIEKLAESAEMLAKSERESAWREMAKQVAHEIKNPLTPMKLNIQHLQRLYKELLPTPNSQLTTTNYEVKIEKISTTLIEQIDILSDIATQFSDFAKMPFAHNEIIDLNKVINNAVELYNNIENITININLLNTECKVFADYRQLLRVFNNLIKNSLQAVEYVKNGIINIDLSENEKDYIVKIEDNGKGINEKDKDRIFSPYFTTRTSGTGLGLSLAKSIVESAGGKIWFESVPMNGTIFYISLPKV